MEIPKTELATKYLRHQTQSETDGKSCIPMYRAVDPKASDQNDQKRKKLSFKFISVAHNGETIYIRKSTLVWLFQEGERVKRYHQVWWILQEMIVNMI